ncbi:MAG: glycerol-3-phosphate 1-O-acyltransferase PlsY [Candidatus Omnitrophota bacterium]
MIYIIFAVLAAYLLGSFPTAYVFGKVLKNIDIREHGSGNVGATNVFRVIGKTPGIIALVIDFAKGLVAVTVLPAVLVNLMPGELPSYVYILLGTAAIAGHIWTIFLRFKGGKGVATTAGVMAGLAPVLFAVCLSVWVFFFAVWRYVSVASIAAAVSLPFFAMVFGKDLSFVIFCSAICMVGAYSHRSNIKRLLNGEEKKLL